MSMRGDRRAGAVVGGTGGPGDREEIQSWWGEGEGQGKKEGPETKGAWEGQQTEWWGAPPWGQAGNLGFRPSSLPRAVLWWLRDRHGQLSSS